MDDLVLKIDETPEIKMEMDASASLQDLQNAVDKAEEYSDKSYAFSVLAEGYMQESVQAADEAKESAEEAKRLEPLYKHAIVSGEQTQESEESGGVNIFTFTDMQGNTADFRVRNGKDGEGGSGGGGKQEEITYAEYQAKEASGQIDAETEYFVPDAPEEEIEMLDSEIARDFSGAEPPTYSVMDAKAEIEATNEDLADFKTVKTTATTVKSGLTSSRYNLAVKQGNVVTLSLDLTFSAGTNMADIITLPEGFRPTRNQLVAGTVLAGSTVTPMQFEVTTTGKMSASYWGSGTNYTRFIVSGTFII